MSDARLAERAHPSDWRNPTPLERYDLVVIGGGTAGLVSAHGAAGLGARVALVERALLGGDCLVTGCVPSKALLRSARAAADVRRAGELGVSATLEGVDFAAVMDRMRRLRADIAENDSAARLADAGVDVFFGDARFVARDAVDVGGATLRFGRAILATGARAAAPRIPGLVEVGYLTNETVFDLRELPSRLVVVGGGAVGVELAQCFARLGSAVTLVGRQPRLLPKDDADAAAVVAAALERDGVRLLLGAEPTSVERSGRELLVTATGSGSGYHLPCDAILIGVGRAPNVEGLGLEVAGVEAGTEGVRVDDYLATTNPRVLAAGDVASSWKFTHAAEALARVAVQNALLPVRRRASGLVIPWCTYSDPEVAHVGLSADEASRDPGVVTFTVPLADVDRARLDGEPEGFARVHARRRSGRVLGATLVSRHAGESIALLTAAVAEGRSLADIDAVVHCYPTQADAFRRAAGQWQRTRIRPWMRSALRRWLKMRG